MWEIAIKGATGKLHFDRPIVAAVLALGFGILPVAGAPAEHAGGLPPYHNDPFDRLIIAQAYLEGMVLGTQDRRMLPYGPRRSASTDQWLNAALLLVIPVKTGPYFGHGHRPRRL